MQQLAPGTEDEKQLTADAVALATDLLTRAAGDRRWRERIQGRRVARLLEDPDGLSFTLALTDEVLRVHDPRRAAAHLRSVVDDLGEPAFLGALDRLALRLGVRAATAFPHLVMPIVAGRVRAELSGFVRPAEARPLGRYIARRRRHGHRLNLNLLGEAILGEEEAERRLAAVEGLLRRPDVDYVSIKISAICAQINPLAFDAEVERIAGRLRRLYDVAMEASPAKFVNLDMEEFRDLHLTVAVFRRLLDEPRYTGLDAGIVLQAYLPDSVGVLDELLPWARQRRAVGGGRTKIRLVKGANLAMEQVVAELAGWPQAPFTTKADVDANYKRLLDRALVAVNAEAVRVGVATHNVFEVAWALTVARDRGLSGMVEMEMLEGMAPATARAVKEVAGDVLLYAPIARRRDHVSVIAYLVRRFDENTAPDNYLRHQFAIEPGSATWHSEQARFERSVGERERSPVATRCTQDRGAAVGAPSGGAFVNEADTDFALAANRRWIAPYLAPPAGLDLEVIPAVVDGRVIGPGVSGVSGVSVADGFDPAVPATPAYRWVQVGPGLVDQAVAAAVPAGERWRALSPAERQAVVRRVGAELSAQRGRLIGLMARDGGKTVLEGDPEVSEAVDFAYYYAAAIDRLTALQASGTAQFTPYPTVAVIPPWNFPLAIPAGGVLASLAAGSAVVLKPAPETVAVAAAFADACWTGGVPRDLLQFVPCADGDAGRRLVTHPDVAAVILTGSWDTARMFLGWRPDLRLHAETSGKNAIVVTAAADLDLAIADLVRSAFGHAGQKCSAASLAIVEASVYDDEGFRRQLADAVRTLRPGPGWDVSATMGPLIREPEGALLDALTRLQPGEEWLVEPGRVEGRAQLWAPGVKLGVAPGSPFHLNECFGPVLGVMRAGSLVEAIAWQNAPAYGLTAGLHSLDPHEITTWRDEVQAGNLYVNRHITGAIVQRQPFGGWKRSVVGPGAKAGGPNYVASLGRWVASSGASPEAASSEAAVSEAAVSEAAVSEAAVSEAGGFEASVRAVLAERMSANDPSGLRAEANVLRYRPLRSVLLRAGDGVPEEHVRLAVAAARAVGVAVEVSASQPCDIAGRAAATIEGEVALCGRLAGVGADKVRVLGSASDGLRLAIHDAGLWLDDVPIVAIPEIEALRWVREQSLSETRHRHGNLTQRIPPVR